MHDLLMVSLSLSLDARPANGLSLSSSAGHYRSFLKDPSNKNIWHRADDERTWQVTTTEAINDSQDSHTYMLFYTKEE
jgi:ubiquitin C-terminal hydrolase